MHTSDELTECFPYLRYLDHANKTLHHSAISIICEKITNRTDIKTWMDLCMEYAPCLDLPQMVNYLFLLLNQGTSVIAQLS